MKYSSQNQSTRKAFTLVKTFSESVDSSLSKSDLRGHIWEPILQRKRKFKLFLKKMMLCKVLGNMQVY